MDTVEEIRWRGLINQVTDEDGVRSLLQSGIQTVYVGFDPTAPSLHVGSMMQLMLLRRFQRSGHRPIALIGGATGMIGDPSGKSEERNLLSKDQLRENVSNIERQMRRFLDFEGENGAVLLNNASWMEEYSYLDFLRDIGKHFSVNMMVSKDSVRSRIGKTVLSYTEFSYMLIQAYDFVHLCREHGCLLQVGGSDQWGNITAGVELARKMLGKQVFGMTAPLLTTDDGKKMGKTEQGAVWLDPDRTSPYAFYQYWMNTSDEEALRCLAYLTEIGRGEYEDLEWMTTHRPEKRLAQNRLATWMTDFIHGPSELSSVLSASKVLFGGEIKDMSYTQLSEIFWDAPSKEVTIDRLSGEGMLLTEAMQEVGLAKSKREARQIIREGGAYLNNQRVTDEKHRLTNSIANESIIVLRRGKKNFALLKIIYKE